ncbi:MAG: glycoside hydrolase family 16 protein [Clostridia bacterium]|nr:glycoside hydrolase family 16 protein [Clostridia bacterium]
MFERLASALHLAFRQQDAIARVGRILTSGGFSLKKLLAAAIAFIEMFGCVISDHPLTPYGDGPALEGYEQVFFDDFNGDALDQSVWQLRHPGRNSYRQATVENGNLLLTGEYLEDGENGPGWYSCDLQLRQKYLRGYFEIRCKCSDTADFWSAFWIQADHPYDHTLSQGGVGGCELDIFEAMFASESSALRRNAVVQTVHCNGWDDDEEHIDSRILGKFKVDDPYGAYHTYALQWTETEYIFYIDGVESARSSFGNGVSQAEEYVCVSLCTPQEWTISRDTRAVFTVDYVKILQLP